VALEALLADAEHPPESLSCTWQVVFHHNDDIHSDPPLSGCEQATTLSPTACNDEAVWYVIGLEVADTIAYRRTGAGATEDVIRYRVRDNPDHSSNEAAVIVTVEAPPPNQVPVFEAVAEQTGAAGAVLSAPADCGRWWRIRAAGKRRACWRRA
jgi:hypothetical protein